MTGTRARRRAATMLVALLAALSVGPLTACSRDGRDMQPPGAVQLALTQTQPR